MKLESTISVSIDVLHKTGKVISIREESKTVELDTDSDKYRNLCDRYESKIGYLREDDEMQFDKDMLTLLTDKAKETLKEGVDKVIDTFRESSVGGYAGCIELFGWIFNLKDISGIRVIGYQVKMSKKE